MKKAPLILFLPITIGISVLSCYGLVELYKWLEGTVYPNTGIVVLVFCMLLSIPLASLLFSAICVLTINRNSLIMYSGSITIMYGILYSFIADIPKNSIFMIIGFVLFYAASLRNTMSYRDKDRIFK